MIQSFHWLLASGMAAYSASSTSGMCAASVVFACGASGLACTSSVFKAECRVGATDLVRVADFWHAAPQVTRSLPSAGLTVQRCWQQL